MSTASMNCDRTQTGTSAATGAEAGAGIGLYKLLQKQLGEGGFGEVWMAEQREPVKRRVALKIIKLGMDTRQVVARFEAERQALAMMEHPNIAKVLDAGATEAGRPYFVMELVRGVPITQYCDENSLRTEERLRLFVSVCHAIQHAHQKGVIHRDVKPSNVLVTLHDGAPVPKVIDFGIAKATQQELTNKTLFTQLQQFVGTPAYMSPEQAEMSGLDIDTRTDIYSLGVVLYELLTGRTPFDAKELLQAGIDEMRRMIREKYPARPSTRVSALNIDDLTTAARQRQTVPPRLVHQLKGDLDWIVMKCLEKDRTRRYETANGLAMDVNRFLASEPIAARPPSSAYRCKKFFLKHKTVCVAAAAAVLCVCAAALVATSSWLSEKRARADAEHSRTEMERQRNAANDARQEAERQRSLAQTSLAAARQNEQAARRALYAADMVLASRAFESGDLGQVARLLNKYEPANGAPDLRGWEWRHLEHASRSDELFTLGRHTHTCTAISEAPDGQLVVVSEKGAIHLYDVAARKVRKSAQMPIESFWRGLVDFEEIRCFHSASGKYLVISSYGQLLVYEAASLALLASRSFDERVNALQTNLEESEILVAQREALERLSLPELKLLKREPLPPSIFGTISPDGSRLFYFQNVASGLQMRVWDLLKSANLPAAFPGYHYRAAGLRFSPNGRWFAGGADSPNPQARVRDGQTGNPIKDFSGFGGWIISAVWSPDSTVLALGSADRLIHLYEAGSWRKLGVLKGHHDEVTVLAFSRDGRRLYSGDKEGAIKVWPGRDFPNPARPFAREDRSLVLSKSGTRAFLRSREVNDEWTLCQTPEFRPIDRLSLQQGGFALSADGLQFAQWETNRLVIRNSLEGSRISAVEGVSEAPKSLALSSDHSLLAAASAGNIFLWQLGKPTPTASAPLSLPAGCWPEAMSFSPDAQRLAIRAADLALIVPLASPSSASLLAAHRSPISDFAFSPDGRLLVTCGFDSLMFVWDAAAGQLIRRLEGEPFAYLAVAFSHDGTRLASGGADGSVRIWETRDWQPVCILRDTPNVKVDGLAFGPEDRYLIAAGRDSIKIYESPRTAPAGQAL